jgi:hypothetical protein
LTSPIYSICGERCAVGVYDLLQNPAIDSGAADCALEFDAMGLKCELAIRVPAVDAESKLGFGLMGSRRSDGLGEALAEPVALDEWWLPMIKLCAFFEPDSDGLLCNWRPQRQP